MTHPSKQARDLADWMAANHTIQPDTRTNYERPDGALALTLAILIGAYFVIRAIS